MTPSASLRLAAVCAAVSLAGCGGSSTPDLTALCNALDSMITGYATKTAACAAEQSHWTAQNMPSGSTCPAQLPKTCPSASDQTGLQNMVTCVNALATCTTATEAAFVTAIGLCDNISDKITCLK